ncbi:MAG: hypothetical protein OXP28_07595, partial [Gammaproteobacteria bacterium]|nr:hypothetical protein [Gammaproteobacteria bacterium]
TLHESANFTLTFSLDSGGGVAKWWGGSCACIEVMPDRSHPHRDHLAAESVKRLSVRLSESLHTRFKTACTATNREMAKEIRKLVERRTQELEEEAGWSESGWAGQVSQRPKSVGPVERRLLALNRALECNHPTADIEEMLVDIERGRYLR